MEPKLLTDEASRKMARHIRDRQWRMLERIALHNPLYICPWDKYGFHRKDTTEDLLVLGLIDGNSMWPWLISHPGWTRREEWSEERCAWPIYITGAGRRALTKRPEFDMETVVGGMVDPGWQAVPLEGADTGPAGRTS